MKRTALAVTIDKRKNGMLLGCDFGKGAILLLAADQRFVGFYNFVLAADRAWIHGCHPFTDAMAHKPRRFIRDIEHARELKG